MSKPKLQAFGALKNKGHYLLSDPSEFKLFTPKKVMSEYKRQFVSHPQSNYQKQSRKRQEISRMEQLQEEEESLPSLSERKKKYHFIYFQKHAIA